MKKKIFILFLVLITVSCKKSNHLLMNDEKVNNEEKVNFYFYDTAFQFKKMYGKALYNMDLDTIDSTTINKRYVIFVALTSDKKLKTFDEIGKNSSYVKVDSIGNPEFPFHVKFDKLGKNMLNLAFKELIYLKKGGHIDLEIVRSKPVFVLDSSLVVGQIGDTIYFEHAKEVRVKRKDSAKFVNENQRKTDSIKRVLDKP